MTDTSAERPEESLLQLALLACWEKLQNNHDAVADVAAGE